MKSCTHLFIAIFAFLFLTHFSSQDNTVNGGAKPAVNFYGTVTDISDFTYNVEYITLGGLYKQIPVYQLPPKNATPSYSPEVNITRIDLSEISSLSFDANQTPQRFSNREYLVVEVFSNDSEKTKTSYLIPARDKLRCSQVNGAGPIEKEIEYKAVTKITIKGWKQTEPLIEKKPIKTASKSSKRSQFLSYVQNLFDSMKSS